MGFRALAILGLMVTATGCPDLRTSAELSEPQILALVASPPCVAAGDVAALDVVVAGPAGAILPRDVVWSVPPGAAGSIESSGGVSMVRAAADAATGATFEIDAAIDVGTAAPLRGFRTVRVGGGCANPIIDAVLIDGVPASASDDVLVGRGDSVALDLSVDGGLADGSRVSWFTTAGKIELYRHTPTKLIADSEAGTGILYVVYRDGLGGVAWLERNVQIVAR